MLVDLEPAALAALLEKVADYSIIVDRQGQITELAVANEELADCIDESWLGREWAETVTQEGRAKLRELLKLAVAQPGTPQRCDIVHPLADGSDLPVSYRALCTGSDARVLALGEDMRPMASLRQQLINAQQALEQDYWRLRQVETRYRRLFDMSKDALIVLDEASGRVLEANPSANEMLAPAGQSIIGKPFPRGFDKAGMASISNLLSDTRTVGKGSINGVASESGDHSFDVTASFVRQANETRFLVRLGLVGHGVSPGGEAYLRETLQQAPDAIIQTDADGQVMAANQSFLDLAQLVAEEQALGRSADRWLGRSGVDLNVLLSNLRERGVVKLFASTLRGDLGTQTEVEISAFRVSDSRPDIFAFFIRDIGRRVAAGQSSQQLPRSIEQVTDRVGRVPLKELVRESTDIIEAMCIEAALRLTGDNRASAAELLGLSRQSLYAKLRRYDIGGDTAQG